MLVIRNSYLVEVNLATVATNQRYYFPDIPVLRGKTITGAESITSTILSLSPSGKTIISAPSALLLTLQEDTRTGNQEKIFQFPYYNLVTYLNGGIVKEFYDLKLNLVKSYLTITDQSLLTATHSAAIVFYYK